MPPQTAVGPRHGGRGGKINGPGESPTRAQAMEKQRSIINTNGGPSNPEMLESPTGPSGGGAVGGQHPDRSPGGDGGGEDKANTHFLFFIGILPK